MTRPELIGEIAAMVPAGRVLVGVDGIDAAGKSTFADELVPPLQATGRSVIRISLDDFHQPRAVRHQRKGPEGFWRDSFDYAAFSQQVLLPLGRGGAGRYCAKHRDLTTDELLAPVWRQAPAAAVVVIDGIFLLRDELHEVWDLSVFLEVPFEVSVPRMSARDGDGSVVDPADPRVERYVGGQRLYFAACHPWERADVVVDNRDVEHPRIVRRRQP